MISCPTYTGEMPDFAAELIAELKTLRKGRGIDDADLRQRIGPALHIVLDLESEAPDSKTAVREWLSRLAEQLQPDLKLALLVAFGLHPDARHRFYGERVRWLATQLRRDNRTAQRRVDEASELVARLAAEAARHRVAPPVPETPWHSAGLSTVVVLERGSPEIFEWRRVVSHRDGLDVIDLAVTLTAPPLSAGSVADSGDLDVDVLYGGNLVRTVMESSRRVGFAVQPPIPLAVAQHADFALRYSIPDGKEIRPHYVSVPRYRCDRFELRVRFGQDRRPGDVWRLDGAFQSDIDDPVGVGDGVPLDAAGELRVTFDDLKPGFAYGVRWEPADHTAAEVGAAEMPWSVVGTSPGRPSN